MAGAIARLRTGILIASGLLLVALSAFFFAARWKDRFLKHDLPRRLGLDIQQDSSGFTLSKSAHGKTIFTIHAARVVQLKDGGNAELHDVRIVLYGQGASTRQDRISGDNFAYDPKSQTVTARGSVLMDLQSLAGRSVAGNAQDGKSQDDAGEIHLKTSGLTFDERAGDATTSQPVEFRLPRISGTAVGAEYSSALGVMTLVSQIRLQTRMNGVPATVAADHATMGRANSQIHLLRARFHSERGDSSSQETTVTMRSDGSAELLQAEGGVTMTAADGMVVSAPSMTAELDEDSRPRKVHAAGGVMMHQAFGRGGVSGGSPERDGQSREAWLVLNEGGKPASLKLAGDVVVKEATSGAGQARSTLRGGVVDVGFRNGQATSMMAQQSPILVQTSMAAGRQSTRTMQADVLQATIVGGRTVERLEGTGNTQMTQLLESGETQITRGDELSVTLASLTGAAVPGGKGPQVSAATQQGHVRMERQVAGAKGAADRTIAHADRADYSQAGGVVVLTGQPRVTDTSGQGAVSDVAGKTITFHSETGDAIADGAVQGTFFNGADGSATHVTADHAVLIHATQTATFTGKPRMWQDGNSINAPTLTLSQQGRERSMTATASLDGKELVRTVLAGQPGERKPQAPVRVTSRRLMYTDQNHRARFDDNVQLVDADGTLRADQADIFLQHKGVGSSGLGGMSGSLDRIVANGNVVFTQPLRRGTGQELVYTASDGRYVITGSPGRPPRVEDQQQGTVSGETLQFLSHDDRVDVIGGGGRTVTTTHLSK